MAKQSRHLSGEAAVPVLLTRPEAQSIRLGAALTERFGPEIRLILTPLMRMVAVAPEFPEVSFSAVVFTSEAAVEAARIFRLTGRGLPSLAFCVGARTAEAAQGAGFQAESADGDAEALIGFLMRRKVTGPLLYLHGRETRGNVAERLNLAGIETVSSMVYQQDPQPLTTEATTALRELRPVVVPLLSPRSARLLANALPADCRAPLFIAAMSRAVADAASAISAREVCTAHRPDQAAVIEAVEVLLTKARGS
jgi:uroporphyrinogen-III synthase